MWWKKVMDDHRDWIEMILREREIASGILSAYFSAKPSVL